MLTDLLVGAMRPLPLRGKLAVFNTFIPHSGQRSFEAFGCRFRLDLSDDAQRRVYLGQTDQAALRLMARLLRPGGCFVDANAGLGLRCAMASERMGPAGQILAAEAGTMAFLRLEGMIRDNSLNQVILHHGVLAGRDQRPARSLDSLSEEHGVGRVDLLCAGPGDLSLLAGSARLLAGRRIQAIVCDLSNASDERILAQVSVLGFRHWRRVGRHHFFRSA